MAYEPTQDYATAYDAALRRLRGGYAQRKGDLAQNLATRGVSTSGVSSIPEAALAAGEEEAETGLAGQFALEQARTGIEDRREAEAFGRQKELFGMDEALKRRLAQGQLQAGLIGGGLGAIGAVGGGYFGGLAGRAAAEGMGSQQPGTYTRNRGRYSGFEPL